VINEALTDSVNGGFLLGRVYDLCQKIPGYSDVTDADNTQHSGLTDAHNGNKNV
jgi:hypothetical protein